MLSALVRKALGFSDAAGANAEPDLGNNGGGAQLATDEKRRLWCRLDSATTITAIVDESTLATQVTLAAVLAKFTDKLGIFGILGANGSALASATNGVPVVDQGRAFIAGGVTSCATSTLVPTSQSGAGWLVVKNLDGSATVYVGLTGVTSSSGYPLAPGESVGVQYSDVTTVFAAGSTTVGWGLWR